jgi:DNA-binding NarL/FixJ family response regulator
MRARVLIVDDHEIVRLGVRTLFASNDLFEICGEAENGAEAISMIPELSPDVVILDLSMPVLNGFQTAETIHTLMPWVKIVFFSAHEIPAMARLVGADAFVSKSGDLEELTLAVSRAIESRNYLQASQKSFSATQG